ncbi:hypothetical protein GCM10028786_19450 [Flaviaesturariibacter terrae]
MLSFLFSCVTAAQEACPSNPNPLTTFPQWRWLDSAFNLSHANDVELRMVSLSHRRGDCQCFLLAQANGEWTARMFKLLIVDSSFAYVEVAGSGSADSLWAQLKSLGLLQLKGMSKLQELVDKDPGWVLDGKLYEFQLINKPGQRQFYYQSPEAYARHFTAVEDFARAEAVLGAIYRFFGLPK